MAKDNVTFIMHRDWLDSIKELPLDVQDKVIADIVRYGVEMNSEYQDNKIVQAYVNLVKKPIDNSKENYKTKVEMSQFAGRKKKVDDGVIYKMAKEGRSSKEIAEILGCSKSAIDHSEGWRNRKKNFDEEMDINSQSFEF